METFLLDGVLRVWNLAHDHLALVASLRLFLPWVAQTLIFMYATLEAWVQVGAHYIQKREVIT